LSVLFRHHEPARGSGKGAVRADGDSFFKSPIGVNLVGLFFREVEVKSKTSKPDTEETRKTRKMN
jgi:hypothetical protein